MSLTESETKNDDFICFRINKSKKNDFKRLCISKNTTPSMNLREHVNQELLDRLESVDL